MIVVGTYHTSPAMPDPFLVGNGAWCSTCFPAGPPREVAVGSIAWKRGIRRGCNECAGSGRIAFSAERIVADTIAAKRQHRREVWS